MLFAKRRGASLFFVMIIPYVIIAPLPDLLVYLAITQSRIILTIIARA